MIAFFKRFIRNYSSRQWEAWWQNRKIDWKESYLSTWNHPHRQLLVEVLKRLNWISLLEIGCGPGANIAKIVQSIPGKQLGGVDINPEAIALALETFNGAFFKVCPAHDVMMSDDSCDIVLSDMTLIYYGPRRVGAVLEEMKRVARSYVVFSEFHSESPWERLKLSLRSGYHAHDYFSLLERHGFREIKVMKMPEEAWPGSDAQQKFRYIVVARVPKYK